MRLHIMILLFVCYFGINKNASCQNSQANFEQQEIEIINELSSAYSGQQNDFSLCLNILSKLEELYEDNMVYVEPMPYADMYHLKGLCYYGLGEYDKALETQLKCLALRENIFGKVHLEYVEVLDAILQVNIAIEEYVDFPEIALEILTLMNQILGKEHSDYAENLEDIAFWYQKKMEYGKALETLLEALALTEKKVGKRHPDYAIRLQSLGMMYYDLSQYDKALERLLECAKIREKVFSKEHPDYLESMHCLSMIYHELGEYDKALEILLETHVLIQEFLGSKHSLYFKNLNEQANLYSRLGEYDKALEIGLEILDNYDPNGEKTDIKYATVLSNVSSYYQNLGEYDKALEIGLESAKIREKFGKEHSAYLNSMYELSSLYQELGDYEKAFDFGLKSKDGFEKTLGKESKEYIYALRRLASIYSDFGDHDKALEIELEALALTEKVYGKEHLAYSSGLSLLTYYYEGIGDYSKAMGAAIAGLELMEKLLGPYHPKILPFISVLNRLNVAVFGHSDETTSISVRLIASIEEAFGKEHDIYYVEANNLACQLANVGEYDDAISIYLEILPLLNNKSMHYEAILENISFCYNLHGEYDKSIEMMSENINFNKARLHVYESFLNEELRLQALLSTQTSLQIKSNFLLHEDRKLEYNDWLFIKGRETDAINSIMASASLDPNSLEIFTKLSTSKRRLSILYETPLQELENKRIDIKELEDTIDCLDRELISISSKYYFHSREYHIEDVVSQLSDGEVLLDIINLPHLRIEENSWSDSSTYLAFVLKANDTIPEIVVLGDNISIDGQGLSLYNSYIKRKSAPSINGQRSYEIFWSPLEPYLEDVETIYYCPEGSYSKINPGVLYIDSTDSYLMDVYDIRHITSAKDFVREKEGFYHNRKEGDYADKKNVVLVGNPSFNLTVTSSLTGDDLSYKRDLFSYQIDTLSRGFTIRQLPGTKSEINLVSTLFENSGWILEIFTEDEASEENIKAVNSPQVLHIATHGYFFDDITQMPEMSGLQHLGTQTKMITNPLIRSGLIFAGAQNTQNEEGIPGDENGWFTAHEASLLNLRNTELVVLSACDTGRGDVKNGRGVFGLQRAIKSAGAESLIMSMWSISDQVTSEMMSLFYTHWLGGMSKREALKKSQEEIRVKYPHPYYWGAFIML